MVPVQIIPHKKFYKVIIDELFENEENQHFSQISKIWHVEISRKAVNSFISCHVETFRREHEDNKILQSEKDLWRKLAYINDDITLMLNAYGELEGIVNWEEIIQKSKETCEKIREMYKGHLIDKLLTKTENIYKNKTRIIQEFDQYKHFGLIAPGLYNNESDTYKRNYMINIPEDPSKLPVHERFIKKDVTEGLIRFNMKGTIENPLENTVKLESYMGDFIFEAQSSAIHHVNVEIAFSGKDYLVRRKYQLKALSEQDILYL